MLSANPVRNVPLFFQGDNDRESPPHVLGAFTSPEIRAGCFVMLCYLYCIVRELTSKFVKCWHVVSEAGKNCSFVCSFREKMIMRVYHLILVAVVAFAISQPAVASPFNINDAYIADEVPNGGESNPFAGPHGGTVTVGYNPTPTTVGTFSTAGLVHADVLFVAGLVGWYTPPAGTVFVPQVTVNTSGGALGGMLGVAGLMAADQMYAHPGTGLPTVLRYTVGTTGTYDVTGSFGSLNVGTVAVDVLHNGSSILSAGAGTDATAFSELGVSLTAGDFLDFVVDPAGPITSDATI